MYFFFKLWSSQGCRRRSCWFSSYTVIPVIPPDFTLMSVKCPCCLWVSAALCRRHRTLIPHAVVAVLVLKAIFSEVPQMLQSGRNLSSETCAVGSQKKETIDKSLTRPCFNLKKTQQQFPVQSRRPGFTLTAPQAWLMGRQASFIYIVSRII